MIVFALAALLALPADHMEERRRVAEELQAHPEPALETRADLAEVDAALRTPERLWRFVTAPDTPWAERMVAAKRAKLPMTFLRRVAAVDRELAREESLHGWQMDRFVPRYSSMAYFPRHAYDGKRTRRILGRSFTLPATVFDEPLTYDEMSAAPWPWQVQKVIAVLKDSFFEASREAEFWDVVMELPRDDVDEARYFYRVTDRFAMLVRRIDPRVIAAWREFGLRDGEFLSLREELTYAFDVIGLCGRDEQLRGEAMMVDWARVWAARPIASLVFHLQRLKSAPAAAEILAMRIDGLGLEDVFTRGYSARYFLQAVDASVLPKTGPNPNDPEVLEREWAVFREWYGTHLEELRQAALAQQKILASYR